MKRFRVLFIWVALMCSAGFAEDFDFANRFSTGGFWSCGNERSGGFGEVGISLVNENRHNFVVRDCVTFAGYGYNLFNQTLPSFGEFQIGDKFIIGGMTGSNLFRVRTYGFFSVGLGFWKGGEHNFTSGNPLLDIGGGGGFEFQYTRDCAFVVEFGGRNEAPVGRGRSKYKDYTNASPMLTIGYRTLVR